MTRGNRREKAGRRFSTVEERPDRQAEQICRVCHVLLGLFFLLLALAFSTALQVQFTLPKLSVLHPGALLLVLLWAYCLTRGQVKAVPRPVLYLALALGFWYIFSTLFALHRPTALDGFYGRYNGLWTHLTFLCLFLVAASLPLSAAGIRKAIGFFVLALTPVALYGIAQHLGLDPLRWPSYRPASTIGHPVIFAALLCLAIPFAIAFLFEGGRCVRWAAAAVALLSATLLSLSRGPWLGLAVACAVLAGLVWGGRIPTGRKLGGAAVVGALIIGVAVLSYRGMDDIQLRLRTFSQMQQDVSAQGRMLYYEAALKGIGERPAVGSGFDSFRLIYPAFRTVEDNRIFPDVLPTMVHNGYLQTVLTNGIPALALYLCLVAVILTGQLNLSRRTRDKVTRLLSAAFVASIAGYLVQDFFGWLEIGLSPFFWVVLGLSVSLTTAGKPARLVSRRSKAAGLAVAVACSIVLVVLTLRTAGEVCANGLLYRAQSGDVRHEWPRVEANVTEALRKVHGNFYYEDMAGSLYARRYAVSGDAEAYREAAALFEQAAANNPWDVYVLIHRIELEALALQKGTVLRPVRFVEDAVRRVVVMDRNNATAREAAAKLRFSEKRYAEALKLTQDAKALRPGQPRYQVLEGDIYRQMKDTERSRASYRAALAAMETSEPKPGEWIAAKLSLALSLAEIQDYQSAIGEIRGVLSRDPNNLYSYLLLGDLYVYLNDFDRSREAFTAALRIEPSNPQARKGIEELKKMTGERK